MTSGAPHGTHRLQLLTRAGSTFGMMVLWCCAAVAASGFAFEAGAVGLAVAGRDTFGPTGSDLRDYHLSRVAEHRARIESEGLHWSPGMTWVAAYTPEELEQMLGLKLPEELLRHGNQAASLPYPLRRDLPAYYDWRDQDGMTPVKHQGNCGSCWDFAACGALEASIKIHGSVELDLSEQQVLSCATPGWGCNGGWASITWTHYRDYGAVSEECMPYEADDEVPCTEDECELIAATREWIDIPSNVDAIKTAVHEYGPVTTGFAVQEDFFYYDGGCYELEGNYGLNHLMVIAGWDDDACGGEGAWLVKNSWGEGWGESGYSWIKYGTCKVGTHCQQVPYYAAEDLEFAAAEVVDGALADGSRGDGDARLDPGETADLSITIKNAILADVRTGIAAQLGTTSELVEVLQADATAPDLQPGESAFLTPVFTVAASPYAPIGEAIEFELVLTADGGYVYTETFTLQLGDIPILLVDDDGGTIADPFFKAALEDGGYLYRVWDTRDDGSPPASLLEQHAAVLWLTGVSGRFDEDDQAAVDAYLAFGGGFCASGQDIGWYLNDWGGATPEDQDFYENSLHAIYLADDSGFRHLGGVADDPVGDGLSFDLGGGDGSGSQDYPSWVSENAGAVPILNYDPDVAGAVRYEGDYRLVYYAFGLEAINLAADRALLVERTLEYLVEEWPDLEQPAVTVVSPQDGDQWWPGSEVTIAWDATDNVDVTSVDIWLSRDGGATFPENLASGLPDEGSYLWEVSGEASEQCMIEIIVHDAAGLMGHDYSELFEILDEASGIDADGDGSDEACEAMPLSWGFSVQPNPLLRDAWLQLTTPRATDVDVTIHDVTGRLVRALHRGPVNVGMHSYSWHGMDDGGRAVPGGMYFARVAERGGELFRRRVLVVR